MPVSTVDRFLISSLNWEMSAASILYCSSTGISGFSSSILSLSSCKTTMTAAEMENREGGKVWLYKVIHWYNVHAIFIFVGGQPWLYFWCSCHATGCCSAHLFSQLIQFLATCHTRDIPTPIPAVHSNPHRVSSTTASETTKDVSALIYFCSGFILHFLVYMKESWPYLCQQLPLWIISEFLQIKADRSVCQLDEVRLVHFGWIFIIYPYRKCLIHSDGATLTGVLLPAGFIILLLTMLGSYQPNALI